MLEIINERGEIMEYTDSMGIPIERNNLLFNDADKFFQDITFPGRAPMSPANKSFFGNGQYVDAPAEAYEFKVSVFVAGVHYFNGTISYKIANQDYDFNLKINLGALASKIKNTRLTEISTTDAYRPAFFTTAGWEDHAKDTLVNPQKYPYAYFPVRNTSLTYGAYGSHQYYNHFDYATQKVVISPPAGKDEGFNWNTCNSPYFKLTYIVKKVSEWLGLTPTGSFFNTENDKIYLFHPIDNNTVVGGAAPVDPSLKTQHSMFYMPNITISEFFKLLRLRFKISFSFDLKNSLLIVEEFKQVLNLQEVMDLSDFVESVAEIEEPAKKGYTITLKPDSRNPLFKKNDEFYPTNQLVIGDGAEAIEIDCGTFKKYDRSPATTYSVGYISTPQGNDYTTINDWPLLLMKYDGMTQIEPGKFFPSASPLELTEDDALYYQFMNHAKRLKIIATFPSYALADINDYNGVVSFSSKDGDHIYAMIEKMKFDIGNKSVVKVAIDALTVLNRETFVRLESLEEAGQSPITSYTMDLYKVYFDPALHGFDSVKPEYVIAGMTTQSEVVKIPTDSGGAGGQIGMVVRVASSFNNNNYEVRIKEGKPKYAWRLGNRYNFVEGPGYWYVVLPNPLNHLFFTNNGITALNSTTIIDNYGAFGHLWIVF